MGEFGGGEVAEVTVGAFAIGVSGVRGGGGGNDLHERIPEGFPLEQTFANSGFAGNLDRLATAAQGGARAMDGGEGARGIGIGKGGEELAQIVQGGVPAGPAEARSAAHQAAAEEELAEAHFILADGAEHVLHEFAKRHVLHDDGGEGNGLGGFGTELDADSGRQRHRFSR